MITRKFINNKGKIFPYYDVTVSETLPVNDSLVNLITYDGYKLHSHPSVDGPEEKFSSIVESIKNWEYPLYPAFIKYIKTNDFGGAYNRLYTKCTLGWNVSGLNDPSLCKFNKRIRKYYE